MKSEIDLSLFSRSDFKSYPTFIYYKDTTRQNVVGIHRLQQHYQVEYYPFRYNLINDKHFHKQIIRLVFNSSINSIQINPTEGLSENDLIGSKN